MRAHPMFLIAILGCGRGDAPPLAEVPPALLDPQAEAAAAPKAPPAPPTPSAAQLDAYLARRPKSVLEAQLYRQTASLGLALPDGRSGTATLVDLAPATGVWWTVSVAWDGGTIQSWHLENPAGTATALRLDASFPTGLVLTRGGVDHPCDLWGSRPAAIQVAADSGAVYAPLCGGALALRNPSVGNRTRLEWTTDFLRDHVWGGEKITSLVKATFFEDLERQTSELGDGSVSGQPASGGPVPASVAPEVAGRKLYAFGLDLPLDGAAKNQLAVGAWYPVQAVPGVWVSVLQPRYVDPQILARNAPLVNPLDATEGPALVYTVAFDLADFDLGYELGSDHPRVGWSEHAPDSLRGPSLPGPDGFGTLSPLARTGMLDPAFQHRLVGVFAAGYKRDHGAMLEGELAKKNAGSHYGFVEFGTELSHLQPGLATLVVWADQTVEMKTWTEADAARLWEVRHARQNGVPLVERDAHTGLVRPGMLVTAWRKGNWSGTADGVLRAVRGGVCLQESARGRFLIYSFFSSATPSAMADAFTAYQCSYGMLMDMNALEHTYLSVTVPGEGGPTLRHLIAGMAAVDRQKNGHTYPRFVGYADNRDFFYLLRRDHTE